MASYKKHVTGWEYRIRYKDVFTQTYKEKSQRGFATKPEAKLAAEEAERLIRGGFEQTDIKFIDYLNIWIDTYKKDTIRINTLKMHQRNIKNHIAPYFKNIMLKDLKPIMYQDFLNHMTDKGYSKRTVSIAHATMHNAMSKAVTLGKIEKNPCESAEVKGKSKKQDQIKFIDSGSIPVFLQTAHQYGYIYWMFFKLLIETGMRKGEAAALKWTDIDFKNNTITIDETLDFDATDGELFGGPKTKSSTRKIRVSNSLMQNLKYHANWQNQNKLNLDGLYRHDLNMVLCRVDGNPMPRTSLYNAFAKILTRAGLPSYPIHSLRHTHAVLSLEAGNDMKYIQEQLGHGSIKITSDIYAHLSKKISDGNMDRFESFTKDILK